jgi:hypothetical protein
MRNIPVAFIATKSTTPGLRHYTAYDKHGTTVFGTTVYDCGHGAHIAHERLKQAGFIESCAEWAYRMMRTKVGA